MRSLGRLGRQRPAMRILAAGGENPVGDTAFARSCLVWPASADVLATTMTSDDHKLMKAMPRLIVFEQVALCGSFSLAARRLGLGKAVVSHHVRELESELNVELFVRNSRHLALTEMGSRLLDGVGQTLGTLRERLAEMQDQTAPLAGRLRVNCPVMLGQSFIAEAVVMFHDRHPGMSIDVMAADHHLNLIGESIDVAIHIGWPRDSNLRARKLGQYEHVVCAAPRYLERNATITRPQDLAHHRWLRHASLPAFDQIKIIDHEGAGHDVTLAGAFTANEGGVLLELARQGAGLAALPRFMVEPLFAAGDLVQVLPRCQLPPGDLVAVYPSSGNAPAKVQAFVKFLAEWLPARLAMKADVAATARSQRRAIDG